MPVWIIKRIADYFIIGASVISHEVIPVIIFEERIMARAKHSFAFIRLQNRHPGLCPGIGVEKI